MVARDDEVLQFHAILDRVAELVDQAVQDEKTAPIIQEILDWLDAFHREGLGSLVEMIRDWRGELFLERAAAHPAINALLGFYELGVDIDSVNAHRQVQAALDEVRPYLHSHGGDIEVIRIEDGVVKLQMHGSCDGCTASQVTISERIEVAIRERWSSFRRIEVEEFKSDPHPPPVGSVTSGLKIQRKR